MPRSDLIFDTMEFYFTSIDKNIIILVISIWMMYWALGGTIVNAAMNEQLHPPPFRWSRIIISNFVGDEVHVLCKGWPQARDPNNKVIQETILDQDTWHIEYGQDILQERLSCEVRNYWREWNCFLVYAIPYMCIWENPQLAVARGSIHSPESCPLCDTRNPEGEISCLWRINKNGIYLLRWNLRPNSWIQDRKAIWVEVPNAFNRFVGEQAFQLTFSNYFDYPVILECGERGDFRIRGYRRGLGAMMRSWEVRVAGPGEDSRWLCGVVVEASDGTRWRRNAIVLWDSPVGYKPQDEERQPPCIDCAWRMKEGGLWLDRRGCGAEEPEWEKRLSFFKDPSSIVRQVD